MQFQYHIPTKLLFGPGSLGKLSKQTLPGKRALIVISNGKSTRENGYLSRVEESLQIAGAESLVFDEVMPNPSLENVAFGAALARKEGCDFVVGLGGGSSIDCAKAIAVMAVNEGSFWDYLYAGTGGRKKMAHDPLPLVAIPTTAGTGTELDPWMVVTNEATQEKIGGGNIRCYPVLAVVDPELMTSLPPLLTAFQGFDALFHGVECYLAKIATPMSDLYAKAAVEAVAGSLARACSHGRDLESRERVAFGCSMAGIAMSLSGNGSQHAMEHALSAFHHNLPHGAGLIMLSRAYFTHLAGHAPQVEERLVELARLIGQANAREPMDFVQALTSLQEACGVASLSMSQYGVTAEELPRMAENARETMGMLFQNDRFNLSQGDCVSIYQAAFR